MKWLKIVLLLMLVLMFNACNNEEEIITEIDKEHGVSDPFESSDEETGSDPTQPANEE